MLGDYFSLALGSLKKRFLRTLLTMIGIFIGIAAVVSLVSLGQGMQAAINAQFASVGTDKIIIQGASAGYGPPGQNTAGQVTKDDLKLISGIPGVERAAGRVMQMATITFSGQTKTALAFSMPEESEGRDLTLKAAGIEIEDGRLLKPSDSNKIMIGHRFAEEKFSKPIRVGSKVMIQGKNFEAIGIMKKGKVDEFIALNEEELRDIMKEPDAYAAIFVQAPKDTDKVADKIQRAMRRDRHQKEGFEDFTIQTSEELIASVNTILGVLQAVFVGIAAISLLVGGIGIMNTMYTAVLERTKEIGIMKAVGARNKDVMMIFIIESGLLGMSGGAIGILIGVGLSKLVEIGSQEAVAGLLKASFPWYLIAGALAFSFLVGTISGLMPAIQASRLPPVEALRK